MKNLLGRLMSRPFDELRTIAATWGALTRDPNPSHNDLAIAVYHAMVDESAARSVWEGLDPEVREFVLWLLQQRNMLSLADDLPATLGRPPEEVLPVLERTRIIGLVDVDEALVRGSRVVSSGDNLYAWGAKSQPEAIRRRVVSISAEAGKILNSIIEESKRPAPFEEPFTSLLQNLEQEQVQRVALTWKLPEAGRYYKSELIGAMSEFLATGQSPELLLGSMSPASQAVFTFLRSNAGRAKAAEVRTHFGWDERDFRAATVPLIQRALVWDVLEGNTRYLFIPVDLLPGRNGQPNKISPALLPKLEAPTPYSFETRLPYEMTWDLLTVLGMGAEGDIPLTLQETRITKRVAKRINDAFLQPDDIKAGTPYIDLVMHLAQTLGLLVEKQGDQPVLALGPKAEEWANLSFNAQRRRLFGLWQEDRKWSEPATYGTIYWWNSDLTGGRKRLIAHLVELPVDQWVPVDAFLRKIQLTEPFLIWSQEELVHRFGLRALQGFRNQWFSIEGRIIGDMIKTMLFWLGAVDIGRDKQKRFVSFRVTDEGRALLDPGHQVEGHQPQKTLMVQPNYEILVLHPESRIIWNVLRTANLVRHDRVSVYTITRESVLRAVESGMTPDGIKAFLDANTGKGLPQNVAHAIDDWARLVKRATILRATLVKVEDPAVLDEMSASRKTRKLISERLSPTVALVNLPEVAESAREDPWQKLLKELRSSGYSPTMFDAEESGPTAERASQAPPLGNRRVSPSVKNGAGPRRKAQVSRVRAAGPSVGTPPASNGIAKGEA